MKQVLTLEEIDDYVEAIVAFLPTPAQRQFIQECEYAIKQNPQYNIVIQRKLNIARVPDILSSRQMISIKEIMTNTLHDFKVLVQDQIDKTFYVSSYGMAFSRGEDVLINHLNIEYADNELTLFVHPSLLQSYSFLIIKDNQKIMPDEIIEEGGEGYIIFHNVKEEDVFELIIKQK